MDEDRDVVPSLLAERVNGLATEIRQEITRTGVGPDATVRDLSNLSDREIVGRFISCYICRMARIEQDEMLEVLINSRTPQESLQQVNEILSARACGRIVCPFRAKTVERGTTRGQKIVGVAVAVGWWLTLIAMTFATIYTGGTALRPLLGAVFAFGAVSVAIAIWFVVTMYLLFDRRR